MHHGNYNDRLSILPSIFFGAFFTLAIAWMLGRICIRILPVHWTIAFAVGAAAESSIVFLLLVAHVGNRVSFVLMGAVCLASYWWRGRGAARTAEPATAPANRAGTAGTYVACAVLACYGVLYLVNALAPEIEPDAREYHLGLTTEYVRLGGFPSRVGFHEMLPQGLEMLFVPAVAFGRQSAAKLVHFAFLLASLPLIWQIGRRLLLPDAVSMAAALLYLCAPMVGVTGTSAYTDAAGTFFTLATFYVLLVWRGTRDVRYLAVAGVTAGFCYAIKFPGGLVAVLAVAFVVTVERGIRWRHLALLTATALAVAAPWVLRSLIITGNPAAPLFNRVFPNPYFHVSLDKNLAAFGSLWGVAPRRVPYELIVGGIFGGMAGPVFFLLPLALLALRQAAGRLCWLTAVLLALPWWWNTGARFLMPSLPFLALALALAVSITLPRQALWICVLVQAVGCWPQIFALYHPGWTWRLERIPWRAALRIQPEKDYLDGLLPAYHLAPLLQANTRPGERTFLLLSFPTAYTDREVLDYWSSARADRIFDMLEMAMQPKYDLWETRAEWAPEELYGLRMRMPKASPLEWQIHDITLLSGGRAMPAGPQWQFGAWPNPWEVPLAFDGNLVTRWRTWERIRAGMYVEADFGRALNLSGASVSGTLLFDALPFEFYGRTSGGWRLLQTRITEKQEPLGDVRREVTRAIRREGFEYIMTETNNAGLGVWGASMAAHAAEWGLEKAASTGSVVLFRIK